MILKPGEKVFIVSRRYFDSDIRRHFVGEVEECTEQTVRATGFVFIMNASNEFEKKPEKRTRIFPLTDGRIIANVIPADTALDTIRYHVQGGRLVVSDDRVFSFDIDEFRKV